MAGRVPVATAAPPGGVESDGPSQESGADLPSGRDDDLCSSGTQVWFRPGMNRHLTTATMISASLSMLVLAGCGDDDQSLTAAEFRDQANAICAQGNQDIGEAAGSVFGSEAPAPEDLQSALDAIVSISNRQLDDIEELDAPSDLEDEVADLVEEGRSATEAAEAQGLAFFESDDDPWARTGELASGLGLDACSGG